MNAITFLAIRSAHVLVAGLWIGSTVFGAALLMPAIDAAGPSGGLVMMRLVKKGYAAYMSAISLTTLVTGVYLLWRFTGGFDLSVAATHAGMAFGAGGVAGILAGVIGGAVVGRSARELSALGALLSRRSKIRRGASWSSAPRTASRMRDRDAGCHRAAVRRTGLHGRGALRLTGLP